MISYDFYIKQHDTIKYSKTKNISMFKLKINFEIHERGPSKYSIGHRLQTHDLGGQFTGLLREIMLSMKVSSNKASKCAMCGILRSY